MGQPYQHFLQMSKEMTEWKVSQTTEVKNVDGTLQASMRDSAVISLERGIKWSVE